MAHAWERPPTAQLALSSSAAGFGSSATGFESSAASFGVFESFALDGAALDADLEFCVTIEDVDFIMDSL